MDNKRTRYDYGYCCTDCGKIQDEEPIDLCIYCGQNKDKCIYKYEIGEFGGRLHEEWVSWVIEVEK